MSDPINDCSTCRHAMQSQDDRTGPICQRLLPAVPAKFRRRPDGLCGPKAELWEMKRKPKDVPDARRHN